MPGKGQTKTKAKTAKKTAPKKKVIKLPPDSTKLFTGFKRTWKQIKIKGGKSQAIENAIVRLEKSIEEVKKTNLSEQNRAKLLDTTIIDISIYAQFMRIFAEEILASMNVMVGPGNNKGINTRKLIMDDDENK